MVTGLVAMAIKKQEFYEGAALYILARSAELTSVRYEAPLFLINNEVAIHLKYATRVHSPWSFTFLAEEQRLMQKWAGANRLVIGLVCASDGIATLSYEDYAVIASVRDTALHVGCRRRHGEFYEVGGPDGQLPRKVSPSQWQRLLVKG